MLHSSEGVVVVVTTDDLGFSWPFHCTVIDDQSEAYFYPLNARVIPQAHPPFPFLV